MREREPLTRDESCRDKMLAFLISIANIRRDRKQLASYMKLVAEHKPDYLIGSLFFILTWVILYWRAPKSRAAILWASVTFLPIGPLLESLYIIDYWHPEHLWYWQLGWLRLSLEDLVFAFTCSGICAGFFDLVYRRQYDREITGITIGSYSRLLSAGLLCLLIIWGIWRLGQWSGARALHSVNAHVLGCLIALPFVCVKKKWAISAIVSALGGALFMLIFYVLYYVPIYPTIFDRWWKLDRLSGIRIFGVPAEEVYWMAATVLFIGAVVRFCMDTTQDKTWLASVQLREWLAERRKRKSKP